MNVQWQVILTQILGFLIVFLVLRKTAWGPVLKVLEDRREKIRASFADIDAQRVEVAGLKAEYEAELKKIDAQARQRMNEVLAEAKKLAGEIETSARERSRQEMEKHKGDVDREYQAARVKFKEEMVTIALGAAERMVRETLDRDRQSKLVDQFLGELDQAGRDRKV
ncbi:MAG: F0F1 ATP synthase subunit B [Candidatus Eisenbacteria bacterium]|nr:F0F1 ATP synthase subunit B [Candidatus Eisenbacteria bacterium]